MARSKIASRLRQMALNDSGVSDEEFVQFDDADDMESGYFGDASQRLKRAIKKAGSSATPSLGVSKTVVSDEVKRYQYRTEIDLLDLQQRIQQFRTESRRHCVLYPFLCKPFLSDILGYLAFRYRARMRKDASVPYHAVQLEFHNDYSDTYTVASEGRISFSIPQLSRDLIDDSVSDYPAENRYRSQFVHNKEDGLVWLLMHEFCHLFTTCDRHHTDAFFAQVYKIAELTPSSLPYYQ